MIANNDEAKRSKIWTVVTAVTSVLIVIIAIFLLMKMFTGNPLEGSWTDEDGNMDLLFNLADTFCRFHRWHCHTNDITSCFFKS